jgi:hypothetical protein
MWRKLFGIGDLDGAAFTKLVAKLGVEMGRLTDPEVNPEQMTIKDASGMLDLHNVYAGFLNAPRKQRETFIRTIVLAPLPDVPETWDEVKSMLLPVVRDGAYLTFAKLQVALAGQAGMAKQISYRELAPGIYVSLVIDTPDKMLGVTDDRLEAWGVTFEQALEIAQAKLRRASTDKFEEIMPGLWVAPWSDSYAAARLVLPDVLQRVCTNPLVAVPNRDTLFVADPSVPEAFAKLVVLLDKINEGNNPYCITLRLYELHDKTLRAFAAPADHAMSPTYQKLLVGEQASNYQREQDLHKELGTEAFYAKMLALMSPAGEIVTRVAWTKGVDDTYLPPAQAIHFVELDDAKPEAFRLWEVPWKTAEASGLLTPTNALLPRWKVGAFPSQAWLAEHGTLLKEG